MTYELFTRKMWVFRSSILQWQIFGINWLLVESNIINHGETSLEKSRWSLRTRSRFLVFVIKSKEVCIHWFSWHEWSAHHGSKVCNQIATVSLGNLNAWPYFVVISFIWPSSLSHHNLNILKSPRIQCRINCIHLQLIKPLVSSIFIRSSIDTKFSHLQFHLLSPEHRTCSCTWS